LKKSAGYWLIGAGALLVCAAVGLGTNGAWQESRDRAEFERVLHVEPAVAQRPEPVDALGVLRVDRLGWSVIVRPSASDADLARGAGWIGGTALPGTQGNAGIAGHRDTFFRALRHFKINDEIRLETGKGMVRYVVKEMKVVDPGQVDVIAPDRRASLTLVTCYPFYLVGHAPRRFIVKAYRKQI
jgi:sortase A